MAVEYVWGTMLRSAMEAAVQVASGANDARLIDKQNREEQNAWVNQGFHKGVVEARAMYKETIDNLIHACNKYLKEAEINEIALDDALENKKFQKRDELLADCQRAGYIQALGAAKAIIDYKNTKVRNLDGDLIQASEYIDTEGNSVAIYNQKTGTRLDYEGINDSLHPGGQISVYEECFAEGFKTRAKYLMEQARKYGDFTTIVAMNSDVDKFIRNTFVQKPSDARMFRKLEDAGRDYTNDKVMPHWEKNMQEVMEMLKDRGLTQKELDVLVDTKKIENSVKEVRAMNKEKSVMQERGRDIESFV